VTGRSSQSGNRARRARSTLRVAKASAIHKHILLKRPLRKQGHIDESTNMSKWGLRSAKNIIASYERAFCD